MGLPNGRTRTLRDNGGVFRFPGSAEAVAQHKLQEEAARRDAEAAAKAVLEATEDDPYEGALFTARSWGKTAEQMAGEIRNKTASERDDYVVPAGREVWVVSNKTGTLRKHRTKKENRFAWQSLRTNQYRPQPLQFWYSWGQSKNESGEPVTVPELGDAGYMTFATGNENWPYMVVPKWVFEEYDDEGVDITERACEIAEKLSKVR